MTDADAVVEVRDAGVPNLSELERLVLEWLQGFEAPKTRNAYASDLGLRPELRRWPGAPAAPSLSPWAFLPWCELRGIEPVRGLTRRDFLAWLHLLSSAGVPTSTRRRRYTAVCSFYRSLRGDGLTSINPRDMVNTKTMKLTSSNGGESPTVALSVAQIRALFVAVRLDGTRHRVRNRSLLDVLAATAVRADELCELDLDHYRRTGPDEDGRIRVHGKGDRWRTVRLPRRECDRLDAYLQERIAAGTTTEIALPGQVSNQSARHPLFTTSRGARLHPETIRPMLQRIARLPQPGASTQRVRQAARELAPIIDTIHPHQFRHSWAQTAAANGVPVTEIRDVLGHSSIAVTQTYVSHPSEDTTAAQVVSDIYHAGEEREKGTNEHGDTSTDQIRA